MIRAASFPDVKFDLSVCFSFPRTYNCTESNLIKWLPIVGRANEKSVVSTFTASLGCKVICGGLKELGSVEEGAKGLAHI